jgi:F-type H+-transporting ATPase subunit b
MELINLPQLVTQILGFLIVLWILGKYAWPRVLGFIEERQHKIATDLQHAEFEREEASRLKSDLEKELRGIEAQARARIQEAVTEGQKIAGDVKASAQKEATERLQRVAEEIERERAKAAVALKEDLINMAITTSEKILREKLDDKTQRRLVEEFITEAGAAR